MTSTLKSFLLITLPVLLVLAVVIEVCCRRIVPASRPPRGYFDEEQALYRYEADQAARAGDGLLEGLRRGAARSR